MKLALVIGRFQPLHNGHVDLIMEAKDVADKVLVLIGSTNKLPDFKNPFSYEERKALLVETFGSSIEVRPLPDSDTDDEWAQDVIANVLGIEEDPTEVMVFCNPKDEEFYRKTLVFPVTTVDNVHVSATSIRRWWYENTGEAWKNEVPDHVHEFMESYLDFSRVQREYTNTTYYAEKKTKGHPFGNPMEPVSFAVIVQEKQILVGRRGGPRGAGQMGLPGGFVENTETTLDACIRETKEELGLNLKELISNGQAVCMAQAVSENLGDLGVRTLGVNYLFVIKEGVTVNITLDDKETTGYSWVPYLDICEDRALLFFNHNTIVRQLLSKVGSK